MGVVTHPCPKFSKLNCWCIQRFELLYPLFELSYPLFELSYPLFELLYPLFELLHSLFKLLYPLFYMDVLIYPCPNPDTGSVNLCYLTDIFVNTGSGNGLLPCTTKPILEPKLIDHQWGPMITISWQSHNRNLSHQFSLFYLSKIPFKSPRGWVNSLWPSDAIWWQRSGSTLAQVMACCPTAQSHYLNQCWLIISEVQRHS